VRRRGNSPRPLMRDNEVAIVRETERKQERRERRSRSPALCRFFNTQSGCKNADKCKFSHMRQLCAFYETGCKNPRCRYAHVENQSDVLPAKTLHTCIKEGCENKCIGRICKSCYNGNKEKSSSHSDRKHVHIRIPSEQERRRRRSDM
jgi:hypothetical protein